MDKAKPIAIHMDFDRWKAATKYLIPRVTARKMGAPVIEDPVMEQFLALYEECFYQYLCKYAMDPGETLTITIHPLTWN